MKSLTGITLAVTLLGSVITAQAAERDEGHLQVCASELQDYYGADTEIKLVARQRFPDGVRMRVAAKLDADNARFATCWVANDDVTGYEFGRQQQDMIAVTGPLAPGR